MKTKKGCIAVLTLTLGLCATTLLTRPGRIPPKTRTFDFTYTAEIKDLPPGSLEISMWIPVPKADANQEISGLSVRSSSAMRPVARSDPEYGNQNFYVHVSEPEQRYLRVVMKFQARRRELRRDVQQDLQEGLQMNPTVPTDRWLKPDRLAPIGGRIRECL